MKVLAFGEVLWDIYADEKFIGGAPFNFAAHFAKLGGEAYLLSAVGKDALAKDTLRAVAARGIRTDHISVSDLPTGQCLVTLDADRIPSYHLLDHVAYDDVAVPHLCEKMDVLYFGTLALREAHNREVLRRVIRENDFSEIFVDVNIRPPHYSEETVRFAMEHATFLKISDEELPTVLSLLSLPSSSREADVRAIAAAFSSVRYIIITLGGEGALLYDCFKDSFCKRAAEKVCVVSTVGAGDSFSAAFLVHFLGSHDGEAALAFASRVAGLVVSHKDAVPDYSMGDLR